MNETTDVPASHDRRMQPTSRQRRRRELWWGIRYAIIAIAGAMAALAVTYLLRKAGY